MASRTRPATTRHPSNGGAAVGASPPSWAVLDALPHPTAVLDPTGTITWVNAAWNAALDAAGVPADGEDGLGRGASYLAHGERVARSDLPSAHTAVRDVTGVRAVLEGRQRAHTAEHACGDSVYLRRAVALPDGWVLITLDDVTRRPATQAAPTREFLHDPLTGLLNRTGFIEHLRGVLPQPRTLGEEAAVLFCDIDAFEHINESFGHALGDRVLAAVARRMAERLPERAALAHFGGNTFTVLHEGVCGQLEAIGLARVLANAVAEPLDVHGFELCLTISTGIAMAEPGVEDPHELLRSADAALHRAKRAGHGGLEVHDPALASAALERLTLVSELRRALCTGELRLAFQPIVDLAGGTVESVEALVRWQHPTRGLLPPAAFIDVAEETGLIVDIGTWVLSAALEQVAAWEARGRPMGVSVNLSPRQLLDPDLPWLIAGLLAQHGVPAERLTLEITESTLMGDVDAGIQVLEVLSELGVTSAIDDFGTGFSSLAYLRALPVATIKIDRSFVAGLAHRSGDEAIISAVVGLCRTFGLRVVAEGVQTPAQHAALTKLGCDAAQGYLYGRPAPAPWLDDGVPVAPVG